MKQFVTLYQSLNRWEGFLSYGMPVICFAIAIFLLSHASSNTLVDPVEDIIGVRIGQEVLHTAEFSIFTILIYRLLNFHLGLRLRSLVPITFSIALTFGGTDELHQAFVPGRDANLYDLWFDALGVTLSLSFIVVIACIRRRKYGLQ